MIKYMLVAEVLRGVDEWRTMFYCDRGYVQWTYAQQDAKVWARRGWAERKRDYFDRDIISWVRDARVEPFKGFRVNVCKFA